MPMTRRALFERLGATAAASTLARRAGAASMQGLSNGEVTAAAESRALVRLHRNENAYGPSPAVATAIRESASAASRYPDVEAEALRRTIADRHRVAPEQVVLGCGSGEILRMAIDAFARPPRTLVAAQPTFEGLGEQVRLAGVDVRRVPLRRDYSHDISAMLASSKDATGLVYICNPNNPTGTLTSRDELERLLRSLPPAVHVVMDEAYHDYVGESPDYASFIDRPVKDRRLIVTRTFSKIHGLAGLRVGYAIAASSTARVLVAHQLAGAVSMPAAVAAAAALVDAAHVRMSASRNADDRQEFLNQAIARTLRPIDTHANFVMINTGGPAADVVGHLAKHRILVAGPFPAFDNAIRVTMGTPADMREFWRVWDLMPRSGHTMSMV